jgi:Transcriptional regulator SbtR-like, C-terminal domain
MPAVRRSQPPNRSRSAPASARKGACHQAQRTPPGRPTTSARPHLESLGAAHRSDRALGARAARRRHLRPHRAVLARPAATTASLPDAKHARPRAGELAQTPDRGEAFFTFFYEVVAEAATSRAILEALARTGIELKDTAIGQAGDELKQSLAKLFIRAQKAGATRSDLTATDLNALVNGALATQDGGTERSRRLALAVIVDGLRARPDPARPIPDEQRRRDKP